MYQNMDSSKALELNDIDKDKERQARESHCEIERRRRIKMAAYFNELCSMVPTCNTLQRKPDKLTILRMASSHMRNLRGSQAMSNDNSYKPSFLTDQELKHLILEAADGFLFVAQCDSGNLIYVSDAIQPVLCYTPNEWYHRSLFDFIHIDDLEKVKEQLSSQESNQSGRVLDLKTGTVKKESHSNSMRSHISSRRAFICRVRIGNYQNDQTHYTSRLHHNRNTLSSSNHQESVNNNNYSVVHVTGYTKSWPPQSGVQQPQVAAANDENLNLANQFCLIAIARIQATSIPNDALNSSNSEFVTRTDEHQQLTFVDQRVTQILGYQPNDMLKKPIGDFCMPQDQAMIKEQLKMIFDTKNSQSITLNVHLKASNQEFYPFKLNAYAFTNPYSDEFEFIVCTFNLQKPNSSIDQLGSVASSTTSNTSSYSHLDTKHVLPQQQQQPLPPQQQIFNNTYMQPTQDAYMYGSSSAVVAGTTAASATSPLTSSSTRISGTSAATTASASLRTPHQQQQQQTYWQNYDVSGVNATSTPTPNVPQYASAAPSQYTGLQQQQHLAASYGDWNIAHSQNPNQLLTNNWQQAVPSPNDILQQQQQQQSQHGNYDVNGYHQQYMPM